MTKHINVPSWTLLGPLPFYLHAKQPNLNEARYAKQKLGMVGIVIPISSGLWGHSEGCPLHTHFCWSNVPAKLLLLAARLV